ncbi:TPA: hypothetical protein N0F65_004172, partial [Lagenidium giganteum]
DLHSVSMELQREQGTFLADTSLLFDHVVAHHSEAAKYLAPPTAEFVDLPDFENGVVKVINGHANDLRTDEKAMFAKFMHPSSDEDIRPVIAVESFAKSALCQRAPRSTYGDLPWVPPTSNDVERLFATAGRVMTDLRKAMEPSTLETTLMLRYNRPCGTAKLLHPKTIGNILAAEMGESFDLTLDGWTSHSIHFLSLTLQTSIMAYCTYFSKNSSGRYRCNECGTMHKQQEQTGYINLMSHMRSKHDGYRLAFVSRASTNAALQTFGFVNCYTWMQWVIQRNHPISEVDNQLTREMSQLDTVCSKMLKADMQHVAKQVGLQIQQDMKLAIGLMIDGWTHSSRHYVAVYTVYMHGNCRQERLLALSPFDDGSQRADAHIERFENALAVYYKPTAAPIKPCKQEEGFACRLQREPLLARVKALMPNAAAELAKHTNLKAVKRNATRWSSTYEMLSRYVAIRDKIKLFKIVEDDVPTQAQHKRC